jgi:outer membrane protein OmpA-like peptidoglycan-associated protein
MHGRFAVFGAMLAGTLALAGSGRAEPFERDTDRPGHDIARIVTSNETACRQACIREPACAAFTFVPHDGRTGACWLKDVVPLAYSVPGMVSGLVTAADRQPAQTSPAPPLRDLAASAAAALGCQQLVSAVVEAGRVTLQGVHFDFNRATIRPDSLPALIAARDAIRTLGGEWTLEGHTDNIGGRNYNLRLSMARAQAVADWLVAAGIPIAQLRSQGFSFDRPVADNATDEGRARNRRVELVARALPPGTAGFGGPAGVEPEGCAATAAEGIADAAASGEAVAADIAGFDRVAGPEWLPHAYFMPTGRSAGPRGASFELVDLGLGGTARMCQSMCLSEAGCMGWSFEPQGSNFVATGRCFRWGSAAELTLRRSGWEPYFAGLKPQATILEVGSETILAEIAEDEAELARFAAAASIVAPASVPPGATFPVRVMGPGLTGDWVEVSGIDETGEPYGGLSWTHVEGAGGTDGVVVELTAPEAGDYALRYVVEHPRAGRRIVHEAPLRVEDSAPPPVLPPAQRSGMAPVHSLPRRTTSSSEGATPVGTLPLETEGMGEDTGYYCPADAPPCRFEDEATRLVFLVMPGFHAEFPYVYETAAGVRAALPSTSMVRTRDGKPVAALNPRQWPADLGPCEIGPAGQICLHAPGGVETLDPQVRTAFGVFAASLDLLARSSTELPPGPAVEPAAAEPDPGAAFLRNLIGRSSIGAAIGEAAGEDPDTERMLKVLGSMVGLGASAPAGPTHRIDADAPAAAPPALQSLRGARLATGGMNAAEIRALLLPQAPGAAE